MAKRSKVETALTIRQIEDAALQQILTLGYDNMSYSTLAQATGISRTGISHHFPRKIDFLLALNSRIAAFFVSALDFCDIEQFERSWLTALESTERRAVLRLFFNFCARAGVEVQQFEAIELTRSQARRHFGDAGCRLVSELLGRSAVKLLAEQRLAA
ncbi:TetR family transcriptional regulator [Shewanella sp. A3A]|nr:TetR family transcriptional regulator [Shewanella ferrihydritica]